MRIGIDGGCLANRRGFGRFARQITHALAQARADHEFVVLIDRPSVEQVELPDSLERIVVPLREAPSRAASARGRRRFGDLIAMGRAAARARLDLCYFPASYSFFPVWGVRRVVVTMHDTLALARPELVFPTRAGRIAWTLKEHAAARRADCIVTVSEASRRDLLAWFGLPADRIRVITEGPESVFHPRQPQSGDRALFERLGIAGDARFLLYVGGLSPHKNLPRLIEAFAVAAPPDLSLLVVGDTADVFHTQVPTIRAAIARDGLEARVRLTGFVPDHELAVLYNRALALVQPSLLEGFGLPPVEAMACGTPILYSRAGSLPEIVGEAGMAFDPTHVDSIANTLSTFLADPAARARLAATALLRAQRFTWSEAARALLAVFDDLDPTRRALLEKSA
jgi:glycosyltransferase involved in cell wall biosynthesis